MVNLKSYQLGLSPLTPGVHCTQAKPKLRRDGIASIVDPSLKDEYAPDMFFEMADLALKCTAYEKDDRPTMRVCIYGY